MRDQLPHPSRLRRRGTTARQLANTSRRALTRSVALAGALGVAYLLAGRMGGDLAAQMARADFARDHAGVPVDLRWFGGIQTFGYSLWTPPVMAALGVRVTGVLATISAVALFALLLRRVQAPRQRLAALAAAVTFTASLAEGRVTFAIGVAAGLGALAVLAGSATTATTTTTTAAATATTTATTARSTTTLITTTRMVATVALAVIAAAASPVVAVYLLLCAAALTIRRRLRLALPLFAAALPLAVTSVVFGDAGRQVFSANDAVRAAVATVVVLVLVPRRFDVLRAGLALALVMVVVAALLPTPLGSNSARLSLLFAVPVAAAYGRARGGKSVGVGIVWVFVLALIQPPVVFGTLAGAGRPVTRAAYFQPLIAELQSAGPLTGRVEVPELTGHWDTAYLGRVEPLSRGWLRQLDTGLNDDVFYQHAPTALTYRKFLDRSATQYVAVADARPTFYGRRELSLIASGLPYLHRVWTNRHWTLYAVSDAATVVGAPGTLVSYQADRITLDAPANTDVPVRIRWMRWLSVTRPNGSCLRRAGDSMVLHTAAAGRYVITSTLGHRSRRCST